jgi:hypothetical protein
MDSWSVLSDLNIVPVTLWPTFRCVVTKSLVSCRHMHILCGLAGRFFSEDVNPADRLSSIYRRRRRVGLETALIFYQFLMNASGLMTVAQLIVSDIVPLRERGKYQGILVSQ